MKPPIEQEQEHLAMNELRERVARAMYIERSKGMSHPIPWEFTAQQDIWFSQADAAISAVMQDLEAPSEGKRYRHKARGTEYTLIGVGRAHGTLHDEDPVVLYRGDDGGLWVRHQAEFSDGRFEEVAAQYRKEAP